MDKTLLIMAAGSGSRYGALKQFDELGPSGEFLFEYAIYDAIENGFNALVLVTREAYVKELKSHLSKRLPKDIRLAVVAQRLDDLPVQAFADLGRKKPWGTAHAVWVARNHIDGPFVVMNADDYYGRQSFREASKFMERRSIEDSFGLVPYSLKDTLSTQGGVSRAICIVQEGFLDHIEEYLSIGWKGERLLDEGTATEFKGSEVTSMNFWIFSPKVFELIGSDLNEFLSEPSNLEKEELYIPRQVENWICSGRVKVKLTAPCADWFGVTYAKDRQRAVAQLKKRMEEGHYKSPLWN